MAGWGQEGAEGPGGDAIPQAVPGPRVGGTDETLPDRGTRVGQQAGGRGDRAAKPPYVWVGALGDGGEGEVVVVQLGRGAVSAGGRGERGGETGDAAEHPSHPWLRFRVNPVLGG